MVELSRVRILLATHNGASFLNEQLASIAEQTVEQINVTVSDDGSTDRTREMLSVWQDKWTKGSFEIIDGPCQGFAENFRSLITAHDDPDEFVAFCDQDDIWDSDKLEVAIDWLSAQHDTPALYCGRTRYVDEQGRFLRLSPLFGRPPDIRNALVQSLAGGNTMVMNSAAMHCVRQSSLNAPFVSHDWWAYIIVTGCGGRVRYDSTPRVSYRLHDTNIIGSNDRWSQRLFRIRELFRGRYRNWNQVHVDALQQIRDHLTLDAHRAIDEFTRFRSGKLLTRLSGLRNLSLYRQTLLGNLGLLVAIVHRKI